VTLVTERSAMAVALPLEGAETFTPATVAPDAGTSVDLSLVPMPTSKTGVAPFPRLCSSPTRVTPLGTATGDDSPLVAPLDVPGLRWITVPLVAFTMA